MTMLYLIMIIGALSAMLVAALAMALVVWDWTSNPDWHHDKR